ncbi:MAG: argininosuccinate lyase [Dehalococcoidia bacterium]
MKPTRSRLKKPMAEAVQRYTASIAYDRRLAPYDIAGSIAHARMLGRQGIIADDDARRIVAGLEAIRQEIADGSFPFRDDLEDIHMNIEARLAERIGDVAGKLHTGRSRNDQIALDMRLFTKDAVAQVQGALRRLREALLQQAEAHVETVIPGYTHLQRAQPVLLAHHLLAYDEMLQRDAERFAGCHRRADVMPLGSGALAGAPYPFDRQSVARELGFSHVSANSMDAVSDRDFVIEFHAAAAIAMMHCSRLAEELVLWSSAEFGFVQLDDAYSTGSSLMPQKKNPDVAELARAKTGRVYGHLMGILTVMKALPLTYNRDLQEDKEALFDTVDTLTSTLDLFAEALGSLRVDATRMHEAATGGDLLATDVADYLVKKGVPFREAHRIVGELVQDAVHQGKGLNDLTLEEYRSVSPKFDQDVLAIDVESSLAARSLPGGTAPQQVRQAIAEARKRLASHD